MLHERVVAEGKAPLMATRGIEPDQVAGYVLDVLLGAFLQAFPLAGA